jgi:FkbM family methyltransferase
VITHLAKKVYLRTHSPKLRRLYFNTFCALVRRRTVEAELRGIRYRLDLGEVIDLCLYLDRYEPDMVHAIEKYCQVCFTVLDIGANIGAHALRFAKIVGDSGRVYAFEPTDYAYQKLLQNVALNRFKAIVPIQLVLSDRNLENQRIAFKSSWPTNGKTVKRESIVNFLQLDDWCDRHQIDRVDLIKLDVDGNEFSVLSGGLNTIKRDTPIMLMEVWGGNFSDGARNPFLLLQECGYRFFDINSEEEYSLTQLREKLTADGKLLDTSFNIVAHAAG